jgi:hypothetical protein
MKTNKEIDPRLARQLDLIKVVQERNPQSAARGRAAFLAEAQNVARAVSPVEKRRLNEWMHPIQSIFDRSKKEHSPMFATLATILFILTLVLGGGGVTMAAAQPSLPDQPLYEVKLWSEELRAALATSPQSELQLALERTDRRSTEVGAMLATGKIPPEAVQQAWQDQIELTLHLSLEQPEAAIQAALTRVQEQLRAQLQSIQQIRLNEASPEWAVQARLQAMLRERLAWADIGLTDPVRLREQFRQQEQDRRQAGSPTGSAQPADGAKGAGGGNPWTEGTPTPGSGYGPGAGDGECQNCTPAGTAQGGNPWTESTPTPGSGYGPGPGSGECQNCTPTGTAQGGNPWIESTPTPGSGYGPGAGPGQPGPQEPGSGNGSAATQPPTDRQGGQGGAGGTNPQEPGGQSSPGGKGGGKNP